MADLPSPARMLVGYDHRKDEVKQQLHDYLILKTKQDRATSSLSSSPGPSSEPSSEFVHKILDNHEKLHFYALVELLRLDFRADLLQVSVGAGESEGGEDAGMPGLDESFFADVARLEADLTAMLTSIGSLTHAHRSGMKLVCWLDDASRLLGAWLIFCVAALLFPPPFLLLKGLKLAGLDLYTPTALRFNRTVCGLILRVSALGVELQDERSPEGVSLMNTRRSVTCFNHASTIDAFVLPAVNSNFSFMLGKKELFALPFFSWLLAVFGGIPISRKDRSSAIMSLQLAADSVRPGQSVTISPEGTRSPSGLLLPFKKGPFYLWEAMHQPKQEVSSFDCGEGECLVQPVLITGACDLFPASALFSVPGVAQVRFLEPIRPSELPQPASRDAMSALLRRRLLAASLCPHLSAGLIPPATARRRATLSLVERGTGLVALLGTVGASWTLFSRLYRLLTDEVPAGMGLSGLRAAGYFTAFSVGVTAAIFAYYSLKLRRGAGKQKDN